MKPVVMIAVVVASTPGLCADDWHGFRGAEKQGRGDATVVPLNWAPSQNVVWKSVIPGRGHSSPVVSGDAVYLTTAYESSRSSLIPNVWNYTIFALALLFVTTGIGSAMQNLKVRQRTKEKVGPHIRFVVFIQFLVGTVVVALLGRHLLDMGDDRVRGWLVSIVLMLSCLALSLLFVPWRSRQYVLAGSLCFALAVLVFTTLRQEGLGVDLRSSKGLLVMAVAVSPLVLGLALLSAHFLSRSKPATVHPAGDADLRRPALSHFLVTGGIGLATALLPFCLFLYRAAGYQMPDRYIWDTRVTPDTNWWCVGLCTAVALLTITYCSLRPSRRDAGRSFSLQGIFFVTAVALGCVFFLRSSFLRESKESVRALVCVNRDDGEIRWICEGLVAQKRRAETRTITHASPTPATDGERIYGYFGEDGLMCVSPAGKLLWKGTAPAFRCIHGVGTSPVVKDNVLVVVSDVKESKDLPSCIMAFDGVSGAPLWRRERKSHKAYAAHDTPLIAEIKGKQVIIVYGWHDVKGYDLKTGEELWSYPMAHEGLHLVASPVSDAERLYVTGAKRIIALDPSKLGTGGDPLLWSQPILGEKCATPVAVDGLLFLVTEPGQAFCLNARTGETVWRERLKGQYFSSVAAIAGKVFFTNEAGQTTIVAVDRQFRQLAVNGLNEPVYASFAPVENQLFIRTTSHLYCLQETKRQAIP
jgi:outer membrane protein assembly factor BamB